MSQFNAICYPKVRQRPDGRVELIIYYQNKRMRLQNGHLFGLSLKPNTFPINERLSQAKVLAANIYSLMIAGIDLNDKTRVNGLSGLNDCQIIQKVLENKKTQGIVTHYYRQLEYSFRMLRRRMIGTEINATVIEKLLSYYDCPTSYNNMRRNLLVLFNAANEIGWEKEPMKGIRNKRAKATLNKPIDDVPTLLSEIKVYNENLYLCCLLTYGCLLRPHREVRELKWGDFSDDFRQISLSGNRNKSGRNRVVPVPEYIRSVLKPNKAHFNVFSSCETPFSPDYFKGLWNRFKKRSELLENDQTLYSFRHTGAIDVYKRTGSIEKLKAAMGHSSILVSLTYLRGLEIPALNIDDMPQLPVLPAPPPAEPPPE